MLVLAFALSTDAIAAKIIVGDCALPSSMRSVVQTAQLPQCVPLGRPCVLGGTKCCDAGVCQGPFPNTTCQ